ncbi:sensor domain-containing diguanylate cyclase [Shewanella cutis]|uniref:diguanylate cyclase n=1 Tax=Shewanella cutis TaxID=2766780 RepID=A0ABS9R285_9GAMM|nr:sensor domain-containing diguanylate cyclase [Shewanella sp. PS-2]MCG9965851.1 GGDEF domain-containing protein [Shewanella sp. PS-2]
MANDEWSDGSYFVEHAKLLAALLDSLEDQISVIDRNGVIQFTNLSWNRFAEQNGMPKGHNWIGTNYINVCASSDEPLALTAMEGIRRVIQHEQERFYMEYPCHSPDICRYFMMRVVAVKGLEPEFYAISHINITERKLLELEIADLSEHDPLTGLANRRLFSRFLHNEWRRSQREQTPLSLIMLDLDNFKTCNDHLGHQAGDDSLQMVGRILKSFCQRPADLPCRFGGDEFALILGNTDRENALHIAGEICRAIKALDFVIQGDIRLSASIGVATLYANLGESETQLLTAADAALYVAKRSGKNCCHGVHSEPSFTE